MGSCAKHPENVVRPHLKSNSAPIMIFIGCWHDRLQLEIGQFADTLKSISDALLLGAELSLIAEMPPGTTAAGGEVWTRRRLAEWRWRNQTSYLADIIAWLRFDNACCDLIARGGVRDHYGFTRMPGYPVRTVGQRVDIDSYRIVNIVFLHLCSKLRNPDSTVLHPSYIDCCLLGQEEKLTTKVPVRQSSRKFYHGDAKTTKVRSKKSVLISLCRREEC